MSKIFLAGGCFWGIEHYIRQIKGVTNTTVGYANSTVANPTYEEVKKGLTKAAETVMVEYDEEVIGLSEILKLFFIAIDPESIDKQGEDVGHQYRTGIYYIDPKDLKIIQGEIERQKEYHKFIYTEVLELTNFYPAEEYHQDYLIKNPGGYCHVPLGLIKLAKNYK